jgi:hypothetical protein
MAKGNSGRVVIDVGAPLKRRLYRVLDAQGVTLKDWFSRTAEEHIDQYEQPRLLPQGRPVPKDDKQP